jgi:hypothetical protein
MKASNTDERLRIVATIIAPPTYFADSTNSISLAEGSPYHLEYLLGILNSPLQQWRFKLTSTNNNVGTNELESLPIRTIDFADPTDAARHERMVALVTQMLDLHARLAAEGVPHEKAALQRRIETTDRQIDALVYELYELTAEEIAGVEATDESQ